MTNNMFTNAPKIVTPPPAKKVKDRAKIAVAGLERLACYDALIKALTTMKAAEDVAVKAAMSEHFVAAGRAIKKRPENFRGVEGRASASCELRARSSASALNEDELALMSEHHLPIAVVETVRDAFIVNPAFMHDQVVLNKVSKALSRIKGLPENFILRQEGVTRKIVGEGAIEQVFALPSDAATAAMLSIVGVLAIKPSLDDHDIAYALATFAAAIAAAPEEKAA